MSERKPIYRVLVCVCGHKESEHCGRALMTAPPTVTHPCDIGVSCSCKDFEEQMGLPLRICIHCGFAVCTKQEMETAFFRNIGAKFGRKSVCRECQRKQSLAHKIAIHVFVAELKRDKPCADCGKVFALEAMDFDHVRGEKKFNISAAGGTHKSRKRILAEIAKCDLVCANCHRVRTVKQIREHE
jgi:hypothetical protein